MSRARRVKRWKIVGVSFLALTALLVAAFSLIRPMPQQAESSELTDKAAAYGQQVREQIAAENAAYDEARRAKVAFPATGPLRALFVGDSLTAGYYASTQDLGYSQRVVKELEKKGPVERLGGSKAGGNLSTVGNLVSIPENFNLAVLALGTNDIQGRTDPAVFPVQYADLLKKVRDASPESALICLGTWGSAGPDTDAYDAAIKTQCEGAGGKYIDLSVEFSNPGSRGPAGLPTWAGASDTFHPSDYGHERIAMMVLDHLSVIS